MATAMELFDWSSPDRPWTVSELTARIKNTLEGAFPALWVCGEVSNARQSSAGHIYFDLKDEHAQIHAVIWRSYTSRLQFQLEDGQQVLCQGRVDVYAVRGSYQLVVQRVEPVGEGLWQIRLRQLRERLAREGLFDAARKRPLPPFPRLIGLITSPTGAAVHDFLEVVRNRWRAVHVLVFPVRVQGDGAAEEVIAALRTAHRLRPRPDVLVIARGGGSVEDLWCFNEEALVRAVYASKIPVVSAIGHEIDVTLCDLAADVRALTPTEAAQRVVPCRQDFLETLQGLEHRLRHALRTRIQYARQLCQYVAHRPVLTHPQDWLFAFAQTVDNLGERLTLEVQRTIDQRRQDMNRLSAQLDALSPLGTLARGYSITLNEQGRPLQSAEQVGLGERIETILGHGRLWSRVEETTDG